MECLPHLGTSQVNLAVHGLQHADHSRLYFVNGVVDDIVEPDFNSLLLCKCLGLGNRLYVESQDDGV